MCKKGGAYWKENMFEILKYRVLPYYRSMSKELTVNSFQIKCNTE